MIPAIIITCVFCFIFFAAYPFLKNIYGDRKAVDKDFNPLFYKFSSFQRKLGLGRWADQYQKKLAECGLWQSPWNGEKILAVKELLCIGVLLFCLLLRIPLILSVWFVAGAFFIPDVYLRDLKNRRKLEIVRSLPDFLDMLTLIVEAGLDFGSAVQTILQKGKRNALTDELQLVFKEIRLGASRAKALQNMADRLQIRDVKIFINALIQAEQMGTGLSAALRVQADANRERRMQRAEKLALEAPVKMIFPLVFFIFPVVFIVLIGPMIIQWIAK